jgi:hypothetical protein
MLPAIDIAYKIRNGEDFMPEFPPGVINLTVALSDLPHFPTGILDAYRMGFNFKALFESSKQTPIFRERAISSTPTELLNSCPSEPGGGSRSHSITPRRSTHRNSDVPKTGHVVPSEPRSARSTISCGTRSSTLNRPSHPPSAIPQPLRGSPHPLDLLEEKIVMPPLYIPMAARAKAASLARPVILATVVAPPVYPKPMRCILPIRLQHPMPRISERPAEEEAATSLRARRSPSRRRVSSRSVSTHRTSKVLLLLREKQQALWSSRQTNPGSYRPTRTKLEPRL